MHRPVPEAAPGMAGVGVEVPDGPLDSSDGHVVLGGSWYLHGVNWNGLNWNRKGVSTTTGTKKTGIIS